MEKIRSSILRGLISIRQQIKADSNRAPYFGCSNPLQLTTKGILWLSCGGGDGGMGKSSIYKVDINNKTTEIIFSCTSLTEDFGDRLGDTKVDCL